MNPLVSGLQRRIEHFRERLAGYESVGEYSSTGSPLSWDWRCFAARRKQMNFLKLRPEAKDNQHTAFSVLLSPVGLNYQQQALPAS